MKKIILILGIMILLSSCTPKTETVYVATYPTLPQLSEPNILRLETCQWKYIENNNELIIGMDESNFKCYIKNKETIREQILLYKKFIKAINKERMEWNNLNKGVDNE